MSKHYLCGTDYTEESEGGLGDYFDSVEELKKNKDCCQDCGIVELELDEAGNEVSHKWILRPTDQCT